MPERSASERRATRSLRDELLAITHEDARSAGALGFMARMLVQVGLPHSEPGTQSFVRRNGNLTVSITGHPDLGLPYGRYPRLLLIWLTTEAVRTKSPLLHLGPTLSGFMNELGLIPSGGRYGPIGRLRDQMKRLFSSTIAYTYDASEVGEWRDTGFRVAQRTRLWWHPQNPGQVAAWRSTVQLSTDFFDSVVDRPVPVDLRAIKMLRSPMALDIYTWLTYRMSYLRRPTRIPWEALRTQLGAHYRRARDFRAAFMHHATSVLKVYPTAHLEARSDALVIWPSSPHVAKIGRL